MWPVPILGGSWVVISGVISPLKGVISIVTLLITLLLTTHEPPSIFVSTSHRCSTLLACQALLNMDRATAVTTDVACSRSCLWYRKSRCAMKAERACPSL